MPTTDILGLRIEYARLHPEGAGTGRDRPTLVFLHEGLGSVSTWRDFPNEVVRATGCPALVYSREGYGQSTPLVRPREPDYMHREAMERLPAVLDHFQIVSPILIGHSDGGSISLIFAGSTRPGPAGLIVLAPHVLVEDLSIRGISAAREAYETTDLRSKLARHHQDPDATFRGWNDIWLSSAFRDWNIEAHLPRISCPILAIQGEDDEYGTMEQVRIIERNAGGRTEVLALKDCGHSPQRDQPLAVIKAVATFVGSLVSGNAC